MGRNVNNFKDFLDSRVYRIFYPIGGFELGSGIFGLVQGNQMNLGYVNSALGGFVLLATTAMDIYNMRRNRAQF